MNRTLSDNLIPQPDMRQLMVETGASRAIHEHDQLRQRLQRLYSLACDVRHEDEDAILNDKIRQLYDEVQSLKSEWNEHDRWEKIELFPYASWYLGLEPDLHHSIEQEYGLAGKYLHMFIAQADRLQKPYPRSEATRLASYVLYAYAALVNRLEEEDQIIRSLDDCSNKYDF